MLNFEAPRLEDAERIRNILRNISGDNCQMCLNSIFGWGPEYKLEIALGEDWLVTKSSIHGETFYCFPQGTGDRTDVIKQLLERGADSFYGLEKGDVKFLEKNFPDMFEFEEIRDDADYIYLVTDLSELRGKKYHSKRNHIKYFEKNYNWTYEKLSDKNIPDCIRMTERWIEENEEKSDSGFERELNVIKRAFDNFTRLGFIGGLIRVDGEVIAWTLGEKLSEDTFCTHFEKAFSEYRGAYPIINREFALNELSSYTFVNREEDMGIEGLRKAKLSYNPVKLGTIFNAKRK